MMMMIIKLVYLFLATPSLAFVVGPAPRPSTRVYLEDHIADMIDGELYRQQHKKEFEEAWMRKNRGAILQQLNSGVSMLEEEETDFRQYAKDRKLAGEDPARYCADRCIATGNCDVYEDFFDFSPEQVMEFCSDCVLSDGEEPCDIPDSFYELDKLKP